MFEIDISSNTENYAVTLGVQLNSISHEFDALVIDEYFQSSLNITKPVYWVKSLETHKNLSEVESICSFLQSTGLNRNSHILAIGGGIIQDLVTLAASLYMRGIKWSYAPTTLTGMMDSCLGGKSSINVGTTKNLVGNIYPPAHIYIDTDFISTLDEQSLTSGLAEGVKIAFAHSDESFSKFIENPASTSPQPSQETLELIFLSLSSKKWFIEVDEFDRKERQLLNFGHSFGHAFEAACGFRVQHGLGVALGVLAATSHPKSDVTENSQLLKSYCESLSTQHHAEINNAFRNTDWELFKKSLKSDKKNTTDSLVLILPSNTSQLKKIHLPFADKSIENATETMKTSLETLLARGN